MYLGDLDRLDGDQVTVDPDDGDAGHRFRNVSLTCFGYPRHDGTTIDSSEVGPPTLHGTRQAQRLKLSGGTTPSGCGSTATSLTRNLHPNTSFRRGQLFGEEPRS
jgi:hypothetical protein